MPEDAEASEIVDSTHAQPAAAEEALGSALHEVRLVQSSCEVPEVCTAIARCYASRALLHSPDIVPAGLVQVPATATYSARFRAPHATPSELQLPSRGWHDVLNSIPVESDQRVDSAVAAGPANPVRNKSRAGLTISVAAAAVEPEAVNLNHRP